MIITQKKRKAIAAYLASHRLYEHGVAVDLVLKGARMKNDVLYAWLERRGWRWRKGEWKR